MNHKQKEKIMNERKHHSPLFITAALLFPFIAVESADALGLSEDDAFFDRLPLLLLALILIGIIIAVVLTWKNKSGIRSALGLALFTSFLIVWMNAAVGIIGSEENRINIIYYGLVIFSIIWVMFENYSVLGFARSMFASMIVAVLLGVSVMIIAGINGVSFIGLIQIAALNGMFATLYGISALLFRRSAQNSIN